jgi:hypothetical protein
MEAVSDFLGEDSPGDLSSLLYGVLKGKDRFTFKHKGMQKKVSFKSRTE